MRLSINVLVSYKKLQINPMMVLDEKLTGYQLKPAVWKLCLTLLLVAGETPENVHSNCLWHLRSDIQPLQKMSGDYPEFGACLKAAIEGNLNLLFRYSECNS